MKRIVYVFVVTLLYTISGCSAPTDAPSTRNVETKDATIMDLKTGGIYAAKNDKGKYTLVKILAFDNVIAHVRAYNEQFDELPTNVSSDDLTFLIGHTPLARSGVIMSEHRHLVTVESVSESELEGYRLYLEAMRGN